MQPASKQKAMYVADLYDVSMGELVPGRNGSDDKSAVDNRRMSGSTVARDD